MLDRHMVDLIYDVIVINIRAKFYFIDELYLLTHFRPVPEIVKRFWKFFGGEATFGIKLIILFYFTLN